MKKILCAVIVALLIISVAPIGECSVSDEMIDTMETLEIDLSKFNNAYVIVFTNPKKTFISNDGKTLEDIFEFNRYQMPSEGKIYIYGHLGRVKRSYFFLITITKCFRYIT